jgi:hypothetical protein
VKRFDFFKRSGAVVAAAPFMALAPAVVVEGQASAPMQGMWMSFLFADGETWSGIFQVSRVNAAEGDAFADRLEELQGIGIRFVQWVNNGQVIHVEPLQSAIRTFRM